MTLSPKATVELFHLLFLRQFSSQTDASLYGVKGGCNLRFFFGSPRYSEDLDIDVCKIAPQTLQHKVNKIMESVAFRKSLQGMGIEGISVTQPKQTATTQRWKIQLSVAVSGLPLHTKIEFSRRNTKMHSTLASVAREVCVTYRLPPIRLSHYALADAVLQKIDALAYRLQVQSRDVFDLYHLLHIASPNLSGQLDATVLSKAEEALLSIEFGDYKSQVVNFLEPSSRAAFDDEEYWSSISNGVLQYLEEMGQ